MNALITGASSGIGEAVAKELAAQGFRVVLTARRLERLKKLADEIDPNGENVLYAAVDVTKPEQLADVVQATHAKFGDLDLVLANAGFGVAGPFEDLTIDDFRRQFETNIFGVLHTVQATISDLEKTRGRLGIVGSVNGTIALPQGAPYGMSKFAIRALATSLYHEYRPKGVSVTHLAPGFVESEIRMVNNKGEFRDHAKEPVPSWLLVPKEVAAKEIVWAILKRKRERVVTGHGKVLVFIARHFPWLINIIITRLKIMGRSEPKR